MPVLGKFNESAISIEDKAPGLHGCSVECLNKGGMAVLELLVRLLNVSFDMEVQSTWKYTLDMEVHTYGLVWCIYSDHVQREE